MVEDIEDIVNKFLEISKNQLDSLENKIKRCDMIGVVDSYVLVTTNLQNASKFIPELPSSIRDKKIEEIHDLHDKKHDLVKKIQNFCKCEMKEPFGYEGEMPKS